METVVTILFGFTAAALALIGIVFGLSLVWRWIQDRNTHTLYGYHQSPVFPIIGVALIGTGIFILNSLRAILLSL